MTSCLRLTTTQILTQGEARVSWRSRCLQFRPWASAPQAADLSPSVKLVIAELRKIAAKYGPN
jgi:hypothetical protein